LVNLVAQLLAESSDPRSALLALAESLGDGASAAPREPEPVSIAPAEAAELAPATELAASTEPIETAAFTESVEANESPEFTESTEAADTEAADLEALPELVDFLDLSEEPEPDPAASTEPLPELPELPELAESLPEAPAAISFDSEPDLGPDSGQDDEPLSFFGDDDDEPSGFFGDEGFAALVDIANQALAAETADAAAAPAAVVDPEPAPVQEPEPPLPVVEAAEPASIAPPEPEPSAPPAPMDPLTQWLQQGDGSAILNLPTRSAGSALSTDGQRFLRFHLGFEDTALLPIDEVREVLRIAATDILPVPHMPESVLGVYNWRGEIIWTIDLNQLVGFPAIAPDLTATSSAIAIVLECDGQNLGLVVPQIEDIEWHDSPNVQPPSAGLFPDRLLPFVQGYLSEASSMVLNPSAIARASAQQAG
jgi:chemotaxis signal transduction protein